MFNLSGSELIFLVLIALVVLGPDKLPEAMRKAGKAYADFKRMTTGFQSEMKAVLDEPMRELRETAELAKQSAMFDINATPEVKPVTARMADHTPPPAVPSTPATVVTSAPVAGGSVAAATRSGATSSRSTRSTPTPDDRSTISGDGVAAQADGDARGGDGTGSHSTSHASTNDEVPA